MGRQKIEKLVLFAKPENDERFTVYRMINEEFEKLATFPYEAWETEYIYDVIRNELFDKAKIQLALQMSDDVYVYRSCNEEGKVYTITINDGEIDCNCQWATMYVKTGINDKLCHHVKEVKLFDGRILS